MLLEMGGRFSQQILKTSYILLTPLLLTPPLQRTCAVDRFVLKNAPRVVNPSPVVRCRERELQRDRGVLNNPDIRVSSRKVFSTLGVCCYQIVSKQHRATLSCCIINQIRDYGRFFA